MADKVEIEFVINDKKYKAQLDKVEDESGKSGAKSGRNFGTGFDRGISTSLKGVAATAIRVAAPLLAIFGAKEAIEGAARQEQAINNLNASLARIGQFSQQTSQDLQEFASQLQSVTRFGDEAVLEQLAFAQSLGATAEQSQDIVKAATDLSAALNIDLNSAVRNIGKTLGGFSGELGEVIPELKNLTTEQLQAGAGIDLLAEKYRGFAERDVQTSLGAFRQLSNTFGDLLEELGFFVTQSSLSGQAINFITRALNQAILGLREFRRSFDLSSIVESLVEFAKANRTLVLVPLIKTFNTIKGLFESFQSGFLLVVSGVLKGLGLLGDALNALGLQDKLVGQLQGLNEEAGEIFDQFIEKTNAAGTSLSNIFSEENEERQNLFLENFRTNLEGIGDSVDVATQKFNKLDNTIKKTGSTFKKKGVEIASAVNNAIAKTTSLAIQSLTKSLILGQKGFEGFTKAVLATIGGLAKQLGQTLILTGIGIESLKTLSGAAAIAAGAGLIALGTILESFAGGGGAPDAVGAGGTAGGFTPDSAITTIPEEEREEPGTGVTVNIQGDVLDSDDSGLRIVNLINDAFDKQGVTVNRGAVG